MYRRIRELRLETGLNQMEFAKKLVLSQTGYSKYETGTCDVPTEVLIQLAKIHDVSIDYILGLVD